MTLPKPIPGVIPGSARCKYFETIRPNFNIVNGLSVMEIGPQFGSHTSLILDNNPKSITLIENDHNMVEVLKKTFSHIADSSNINIIHNDVFHQLATDDTIYDIVICFGVLYHFHSPLYLLELITNQCKPEIIILEYPHNKQFRKSTLEESTELSLDPEEINVQSERWVNPGWIPVRLRMVMHTNLLIQAMTHLGYTVCKMQPQIAKGSPDNLFDFFVFKKI